MEVDTKTKEIARMQMERQDTIDAHQNRIKQLQAHFLEQLQQQSRAEKAETEQQLKQDWERQLTQLKQEHQQEVEALKQQSDKQLVKLQDELRSVQVQHNAEVKRLQMEHERSLSCIHDGEKEIQRLQSELQQQSSACQQITKEMQQLNEQLKTMKEQEEDRKTIGQWQAEIQVLKETIRQECEERHTLLDVIDQLKAASKVKPLTKQPVEGMQEKSEEAKSFEQLLSRNRRRPSRPHSNR
jgi:DNA repair exonuclease SbcCD ATPase subunit